MVLCLVILFCNSQKISFDFIIFHVIRIFQHFFNISITSVHGFIFSIFWGLFNISRMCYRSLFYIFLKCFINSYFLQDYLLILSFFIFFLTRRSVFRCFAFIEGEFWLYNSINKEDSF